MTPQQIAFLDKAAMAADNARHIFPQMAACEAALESGFGLSQLAREDNNLFGMKQHRHAEYGTHALPTKEFENGEWITVVALWVHYPGWALCFFDRMKTLFTLAPFLPHYHAAVTAKDAETYIREVSASWATDPKRADKVLAIYREYQLVPKGTKGSSAPSAASAPAAPKAP
jgi:flagellum-specific peptidoglycan hydrolase FlgJ